MRPFYAWLKLKEKEEGTARCLVLDYDLAVHSDHPALVLVIEKDHAAFGRLYRMPFNAIKLDKDQVASLLERFRKDHYVHSDS